MSQSDSGVGLALGVIAGLATAVALWEVKGSKVRPGPRLSNRGSQVRPGPRLTNLPRPTTNWTTGSWHRTGHWRDPKKITNLYVLVADTTSSDMRNVNDGIRDIVTLDKDGVVRLKRKPEADARLILRDAGSGRTDILVITAARLEPIVIFHGVANADILGRKVTEDDMRDAGLGFLLDAFKDPDLMWRVRHDALSRKTKERPDLMVNDRVFANQIDVIASRGSGSGTRKQDPKEIEIGEFAGIGMTTGVGRRLADRWHRLVARIDKLERDTDAAYESGDVVRAQAWDAELDAAKDELWALHAAIEEEGGALGNIDEEAGADEALAHWFQRHQERMEGLYGGYMDADDERQGREYLAKTLATEFGMSAMTGDEAFALAEHAWHRRKDLRARIKAGTTRPARYGTRPRRHGHDPAAEVHAFLEALRAKRKDDPTWWTREKARRGSGARRDAGAGTEGGSEDRLVGWPVKTLDVATAVAYASRTKFRGLDPRIDRIQDLVEAVKQGQVRAIRAAADRLAAHPTLRGFRGAVVPVPRSDELADERPSLLSLARALVDKGIGTEATALLARVTPVPSSRMLRRKGLHGVKAAEHRRSMTAFVELLPNPDCPILLVDDMVTEGNTLLGAAAALRDAGHTGPILAAAVGRAVPDLIVRTALDRGFEPDQLGTVTVRLRRPPTVTTWGRAGVR